MPYRMINEVQHYAWGTRNDMAFIPRLLNFVPEPELPYAELWMGAHPSGPSSISVNGKLMTLDKAIARWPEAMLGNAVARQFNGELPFLFKVLSVAEPLSIQLHPDSAQAARLHKNDPEQYPDGNHKPEVPIALDSLTALVGCRPRNEIIDMLELYLEIAAFAGEESVEGFIQGTVDLNHTEEQDNYVQRFIQTLLKRSVSESGLYEMCVETLGCRLRRQDEGRTEEETLFLKCLDEYGPDDMGLFLIFFLRRIELEEGEGVFLGPGIPHAYLSGNIVECMANSDNVMRLGLTGKYKDTSRMPDMVHCCSDMETVIKPDNSDNVDYMTPAEEFRITRWKLSSDTEKSVRTDQKPEILLLISGKLLIHVVDNEPVLLSKGESMFIPACLNRYTVSAATPATVFRVTVPV